MEETIAAIATPMGTGGISIIRISGPDAFSYIKDFFTAKQMPDPGAIQGRNIFYGHITYKGQLIDEVLLLVMAAPHTFTGENTVEIQCHGGISVSKKILEILLSLGIALAAPGEFSKRAFLNGRLDLSQAEAVMDLIQAQTDLSRQTAVNQLNGNLKTTVCNLRAQVLTTLATIEAAIDYPEHDVPELTAEEILYSLRQLQKQIQILLNTADTGAIIRDGLFTVILGKPNVGKSTLLNRILGQERAIVTHLPGTTRDILQEYIQIEGIPLKIIDTAGIRDTTNAIEAIGIEKTRQTIGQAELILFVLDASKPLDEEDIHILTQIKDKKIIALVNKSDLTPLLDQSTLETFIPSSHILSISAKENMGLELLYQKISELFFNREIQFNTDTIVTNTRHKNALTHAQKALTQAETTLQEQMPVDLVSIDLLEAYSRLGEITGESLDEDVIDKIFSEFCLGK